LGDLSSEEQIIKIEKIKITSGNKVNPKAIVCLKLD